MLNVFIGGPNDGQEHTTESITYNPNIGKSIAFEQYLGGAPYDFKGGIRRDWVFQESWASHSAESERVVLPSQDDNDVPVVTEQTGPLRSRREALKLNRGQIASVSGLTVAKVARIELSGGNGIEVAAYEEALAHYGESND